MSTGAVLILFEIGRYWLLALSIAAFSIGAWLCRTAVTEDKPGCRCR